jgi:hypothetical protein
MLLISIGLIFAGKQSYSGVSIFSNRGRFAMFGRLVTGSQIFGEERVVKVRLSRGYTFVLSIFGY